MMIKGIWTALITPMGQKGEIDWDSFSKIIEDQEHHGVHGLVIGGTTGEAPTLSVQEKLSLLRKARAKTKLPLMAGVGLSSTDQTVELAKLSQDAGADSLLIVTPPYNKPTLWGLVGHFHAIAESVSIPICLYHVPGRTAQFLKAEDLTALLKAVPKITAVKESSGDIAYFSRALYQAPPSVHFLSGEDPTFFASLSVGGQGLISVLSHVFPGVYRRIWDLMQEGNFKEAQKLHQALFPLSEGIFWETNPGPIKFLMEQKQLCSAHMRLPLAPMQEGPAKKLKELYELTCQRLEL